MTHFTRSGRPFLGRIHEPEKHVLFVPQKYAYTLPLLGFRAPHLLTIDAKAMWKTLVGFKEVSKGDS